MRHGGRHGLPLPSAEQDDRGGYDGSGEQQGEHERQRSPRSTPALIQPLSGISAIAARTDSVRS
jgi:hypothetical protein